MSDSKDTVRFEIRIDRASARRALVVGGTLLLMAAAGVAFAVPVSFKDGDTLNAASLNQNFTNLEGRVAALEAVHTRETQTGKYSNGAVYCGATVNTGGDLSGITTASGKGYVKAKAACEAVAGCSPTGHACTPEEVYRSVSMGMTLPQGWLMDPRDAIADSTAGCNAFLALTPTGAFWKGNVIGETNCAFNTYPLLCCD